MTFRMSLGLVGPGVADPAAAAVASLTLGVLSLGGPSQNWAAFRRDDATNASPQVRTALERPCHGALAVRAAWCLFAGARPTA